MKRIFRLIAIVCAALALFSHPASAAPGDLDLTFGVTGKVVTAIGTSLDHAYCVAVQSDGKILVAGESYNGSNLDFALARYNADGSLDASFGTAGKVTTVIGSGDERAYSIALQTDGKIVTAGESFNGNSYDFALARYNTNGSLDTTFSGSGKVIIAISSNDDTARAVAVQSDGKIVLAGYSGNASGRVFALACCNVDGSLDLNFNGTGTVTTAVRGGNEVAHGLALRSDGKIVVVGASSPLGDSDVALLRFNANGSFDTSFNGTGAVITPIGASDDHGRSVLLQADGKIVVAGDSYNGAAYDFALLRYNANGSLDATFNGSGKVITDFAGNNDQAYSVVLDSRGRILAAGSAYNAGNYDFAIARYNANGSLDTSFNNTGRVVTTITSGDDCIFGMALQSDGKIVAGGSGNFESSSDFAVVRYLGDTSHDVVFGSAADIPLTSNGFTASGQTVNITLNFVPSPGTILTLVNNTGASPIFGTFTNLPNGSRIPLTFNGTTSFFTISYFAGDGNDLALILPGPGALDYAFGKAGKVTTAIGSGADQCRSVAVQSDGTIVVAGQSYNGSNNDFAVARYNADGTPDPGFNGSGWVTTVIGTGDDIGYSVAVQSDGRIVVAGGSLNGGFDDFALARYSPDGMLDPGFNGTGKVTTAFGGGSDAAYSVAVQSDGKILAAGYSDVIANGRDFALVRYNPNGALDTSFNGTGKVTVSIDSGNDYGYSMVVQSDGKIVVAGASVYNGGVNSRIALVRFLPDGTLDGSFDSDGIVTTVIGSYDYVQSVFLQSDGKILVAGSSYNGSKNDFALVRYNANGTLDTTFNGTGKITTTIGSGDAEGHTVAVQADGKIVVEGLSSNGGNYDFALARYNTDGTLDTSFNGTGKVTTPIGSAEDRSNGMAIQGDGKIVVAGYSAIGGNHDFALVRYSGTPTWDVDAGFDPVANSDVSSVAMQPDGKLIIGGGFTEIDGMMRNYLARLNADGSLDTGFNANVDYTLSSIAVQGDGKILIGGAFNNFGMVITRNFLARLDASGSVDASFNPALDLDNVVSSTLIQPDGRIVIGGSFTTVGGGITRNRVARLLANGALDSTFTPDADGDVLCMALQADGKILIGGNFTIVGELPRNWIARLNANGLVDASFNSNVNLDVMSIAVQVDGKIVIGGAFDTVGGVTRNHCARLNADGSIDAAFNPDVDGSVVSTVVRTDGRIVIGGWFTSIGGVPRNGVARLSASGSLDAGFAPLVDDAVTSVVLQGDGKVLLGGFFTTVDGVSQSHIARLTTDPVTQSLTVPDISRVQWLRGGSSAEAMQVSFELSTDGGTNWSLLGPGTRIGGGWELAGLNLPVAGLVRARARTAGGQANASSGLVETVTSFSFLSTNGEVVSTAVQPDGKTLIGGSFTSAGAAPRNRIARFNADGTLDSAFNPNANNTVLSTGVQSDAKIVIGGSFTTVGGLTRNSIARLNADGTVEATFSPSVTGGSVSSVAIQPLDGKIMLVGSFTNVAGSQRKGFARLTATGGLDAINPNITGGTVNSVAIQPDGKILIGGSFTSVGSPRNGIARLNPTGSLLDTTFDPNVTGGTVSCIAIQADGQILLGGSFTTAGGTARNRIARVNADGTLDTSFNPNADGTVTSMVVQADGKIFIGGTFTTVGGTSRGRLARLLADGTVDTAFSSDANNAISSLMLKADGDLLVGGIFTALGGSTVSYLALLDNDAATQALTVPGFTRVQWLRGGTSPETQQVTFELSTDGGANWSSLGTGTRIAGGWERTGFTLSGNGLVRARARTSGGQYGGSSGLVEAVASYTGFVPEILVEHPLGSSIADGGGKDFGNVVVGSNTSLTFTITNTGLADLTGLGITVDGAHSGDFTVTASPVAPVGISGGSTTFTVRFSPGGLGARTAALHIESNDSDENPFDINLSGFGQTSGNVDPTFDHSVSGGGVAPMAVQPDGKVVIGSLFTSIDGQPRGNLARLLADGNLETAATFNPGSGTNGEVAALAVQADGKILVGGIFTTIGSQTRTNLARIHADGTFESTGTFNPGTGPDGKVRCIAIQPDGKILIGGSFAQVNGQVRNYLARLHPDGSLESTATFNPGTGPDWDVYAIALQPDGKILLGGRFGYVNGQVRNRIARLNPDGTVESTSTFNPGNGLGTVVSDLLVSVVVQADGKILLGGYFDNVDGQTRNCIARLHPNGGVESTATFNPGTGVNPVGNGPIYSIVVQTDGKILLGGLFGNVNGQTRNNIARINANGTVESTVTFNVGSGATGGVVHGIVLQADGKILLAGNFTAVNGTPRGGLARLANDGTIQTLSIPNSTQVQWFRGGAATEVEQVSFELSTDGGANWTLLGPGSRIAGGWERTLLNLPPAGMIRSRGRISAGSGNGSSGLVEQVGSFAVSASPDIAVEQPAGNNILDGGSVSFVDAAVGTSTSRTFTIKNPGYASLTGLGITIDGTNSGDFTVTTSPTAPLSSGGGSTTFTVRVSPGGLGARTATLHIASNDPDENPFDITLAGTGAKPGTVEPEFDPDIDGSDLYAMAVQPDGKILIGGTFTSVGGQPRNYIARLNADGTLESTATFNPGTGANSHVYGVAVQTDGKILIEGAFTSVNGQPRSKIARLNADGTLESTATFNAGTGADNHIYCMALQADGKILLGGEFANMNGQPRNRIARLNADGTLESTATFNPGTGANNNVTSIAVQADGKILIGGAFTSLNGQPRNQFARLHPNGTVEDTTTFPAGSIGADGRVDAIAVQPDGKIVVGGLFNNVAGQTRNQFARLYANGAVEDTATFYVGAVGANNYVESLAIQADGKILLGGLFTSVQSLPRSRIASLLGDGHLEDTATFDAGTGANDIVHCVAVQPDGKILLGGRFTSVNGQPRNRLARLINSAATQSLTIPNSTQIQWARGGSAPEVGQVTFELSTDGGANWSALAPVTRVTGGWECAGQNLPPSGQIRARGRTSSGYDTGSSGLIEQVAPFSVTPSPDIAVEQPVGNNLADGGSRDFGNIALGNNTSLTFTIRNPGYASLSGLGITIDGTNSSDFTVSANPTAPVTSGGSSTTFTVQFTPSALGARSAALHVASNDPDENPFDITLNGTGLIPGNLDPAFDLNVIGNGAHAAAVQSDGKIVIGGLFSSVSGQPRNNIARLNADGTVEDTSTFNPGSGTNNPVLSTAIQPDGKILLSGLFTAINGQTRNHIARLNADGTLESTATFNPGSGADGESHCLALQPDGKILLAGYFNNVNGQARNGIARLNPDGTLESTTTFNCTLGGTSPFVSSVAVQSDGKILVAGEFTVVNGQTRNRIARLNPDGSLDGTTTFNCTPGGTSPYVSSVVVQPDGKILIGGSFTSVNGQTRSRIARLNADGTLESTATFNPGSGADFDVAGIALQADGRIFLAGSFSSVNGQQRNYVARLNADGTVESTATFDIGSGANGGVGGANGVTVLPDGSALLLGNFTSVNGTVRKYIARLVNYAATQALTIPNSTRVQWARGGSAPGITEVTFELSTDVGTNWSPLGYGTGIAAGWEITGLNLPPNGQIRARGRTFGGYVNGSSGPVEQLASFSVGASPDIAVEQPAGLNIPDGGSVTFGTAIVATNTSRTFTLRNVGYASLTGLGIIIDGANSGDFTVTASPTAPVASGGGSTTFTVQFTPGALGSRTAALHIASNDPDENPFDITLNGSGVAAGYLDPGFDLNLTGTQINAITVEPDGKFLIGGIFTNLGAQPRGNFARLNADGTVESTATFNPGTGANGQVSCVTVQPDGKILLGGLFTSVNGQTRNGIARLNADGTVESTATFNPGTGLAGAGQNGLFVSSIAVQTDGKTLISGSFTSVNGQSRNHLARLNPNGTLESTSTFNPGTGANHQITSIAVQADGKILLGGWFTSINAETRNYIARLNADGTLDTSFDPIADTNVNCIAVQPDGKILIGGIFTAINGESRNRIARLHPNGALESTATFNPGTGADSTVYSVALQADGKILLGGYFTTMNGQPRNTFARLNADGTVESIANFNPGAGANDAVYGIALQADGRILMGGLFTGVNGTTRNKIARLLNDGATQTLTITNSTRVQWARSGAAPEVGPVTFDLSTDGGANWSSLGLAARIAGGWERTGLNLPPSGSIRARGRTAGAFANGSSGLVEQTAPFTVTPSPDIAVEQPVGNSVAGGGSVSFGSIGIAASSSRTFTIKNPGFASLTGLGITIDGTNSGDFTVTASPTAPVASGGGSTTFTVQFAPGGGGARTAALHIVSDDPDENPFDITLNGTGLSAGNVDSDFDPNTAGTYVQAAAVQPDGKILIGGLFTSVGGQPRNNIARLNADGTLESTATFNVGTGVNGSVYSLVVQPDGKILVAGNFGQVNEQPRNYIARLNPDGSVEGTVTFNPGTGANNKINGVALQADGKILIVGDFTSVNGLTRNYIARLNADGSVESTTTFNPGIGATYIVYSVAVQADGKILLGGGFTTVDGLLRNRIARLNPDGSVESTATFNPGTGADGDVYGIAVQADGKILLVGNFGTVNALARNRIARLQPNGSVESTATFNTGTGADAGPVHSVALQANGKILLGGGFNSVNGQLPKNFARLNSDGSVESTATFNPGIGPSHTMYCVAIQADGRILLGGTFSGVNGTTRNLIARLVNDPAVQSLTIPNSARVQWARSGSAPETGQVTFDLSTDGGANWSLLAPATRITGGWECTGLNLPPTGQIRARGRTAGGYLNGSSGIVEQVQAFTVTPTPEIAVEQPAGADISDGATVSFGPVGLVASASRTFTIRNNGYGTLTGLVITVDGPDAGMFTVTANPVAPVTGPGGSTTFTVQFHHTAVGTRTAALHIGNNDTDENPFDITLTGRDVSTNANLSSLVLSAGTLTPAFAAGITSYTASVPYGTASITVTPTTADTNASVSVNGVAVASGATSGAINLTIGSNLITTLVTAEDGTPRTYSTTITRAVSVPGNVDPGFNPNVSGTYAQAIAVQPDGKIVVGGIFTGVTGQARNNIARFNADGTVESTATFNAGTGTDGEIRCLAVQGDGKILVGGSFTTVNGQSRSRIVRLNADGTVESTATFNPGSGANGQVETLALQADGKILLGGSFTSVNGQTRNRIARLNADGTLESTATFNSGVNNNSVYCLAVQSDGKIVIGGDFTSVNSQARGRITRLFADGTLESTATFNPGTNDSVYCLAVQPDGKILAAGLFTVANGEPRNRLARFLANGDLESEATFDSGTGADGEVISLAAQADGKILLGGKFANINGLTRNYFARLNSNGTVESAATFNPGSGANNWVYGIALQADGGVLLAGKFTSVNSQPRNYVARLANGAAASALSIPSSARVQWTRGGAGPEVEQVEFELSTDGGAIWDPVGFATRIAGGWERTGLNLTATGSIRARGRTIGGNVNGSSGLVEQLQTFANAPLATTGTVTSVTATSVILNSTVIPNGSATVYFEYGATSGYGSSTSAQSVTGAVAVNPHAQITGLVPNAVYHYRVVAANAAGTTLGSDVMFTTAADPPLVVTANPVSVSSTAATLVGAVNPKGRITDVHFEYGLTTLYGSTTPVQTLPAGGSAVDVLAPLNGLIANATYHYRIVASNSGGGASGADVAVTLSNGGNATAQPSVTTGGTTAVTTVAATLQGVVNANGGFTNAYFEYGPTTSYGSVTTALGAGNGSIPVNLSSALTGLSSGTLYHYRLVASNSLGTTMGNDATFTTNFPPPTVVTGAASALTTTSVRVSGSVRAHNASAQVSFDYGTDSVTFPNSIAATPAIVTGDMDTTVIANIINLAQGVTYYYRVKAVSEGGTSTGSAAPLQVAVLSGFLQQFPGNVALGDRQGLLTVHLNISGGTGAGWRFVGEQQWRASGVAATGLTTSDRTIEFRPVPGYIQPPSEPVSVVSGGAPVVIARDYFQSGGVGTGSLSVTLKPDALADAGVPEAERAQWRLLAVSSAEAGPWLNSASNQPPSALDTISGLFAGNYLVECKPVAGRSTPPPVSVAVQDGQTSIPTIIYSLADSPTGTPPGVLSFETVSTSQNLPYAYVGQIRSEVGSSTGFVVRPRVVATAGHVVFDDATLSGVIGLQWLFQRDRDSYEPVPKIPRGYYLLAGYSAQRASENTPGSSSPESQTLDAAALWFIEDASRGGFGGYLASDLDNNEWLTTIPATFKTLVGYPVDGIAAANQGRMHATPAMAFALTHPPAAGHIYATDAIRSAGGNSGGPLCVQFERGNYYPAAIFLGGSALTIVRAIDSDVIRLFDLAELSSVTGENSTGGGIPPPVNTAVGGSASVAQLQVYFDGAGSALANARWNPGDGILHTSGQIVSVNVSGSPYSIQFPDVSPYLHRNDYNVTVTGGVRTTITVPYNGILVHPKDKTRTAFESVALGVTVSGTPTSYQWRKNTVDIPGATGSSISFPDVRGSDAGNYRVEVTWDNGSQLSDIGTLTVNLASQTITFPKPADRLLRDGAFNLSATSPTSNASRPVTFTIDSGAATLAGNGVTLTPTGPGTVTVRASLAGNTNYSDAPDVLQSFQVSLETFNSWRGDHFTAAELGNPLISGPTADPERDGIGNLLEFGLNLDPKVNDRVTMTAGTGTRGLPLITRESAAPFRATAEFVRRKAGTLPGVTYRFEFSSNLANPANWTASVPANESVTSIDATWERVKVTDPTASPSARFGRLVITQP